MKAAVFHENGGPEVVRIEEVPRPEPGPGEVRIRVVAAALNHLDLWVRRGLPIETTMPHIGGSDVAGVVDAVGPGVTGFEGFEGGDGFERGEGGKRSERGEGGKRSERGEGGKRSEGGERGKAVQGIEAGARVVLDPSLSCGECEWCRRGAAPLCASYRILGEHTQGGFAEYVVAPASNVYVVPDGYALERAAAAPLVFLTAWRALMVRGRLQAGESVLITGASGGVATAAVQVAKHAGARVFAVTTAENVDRVRALGADEVYDRERVDYAKEVWRDTDRRGVDLILDSVGQATWKQNVRAVARAGRIVVYGATTGPVLETDARLLFWKQFDVLGTTMSNRREFRDVMDLVFRDVLRPVVDVTWPLERAREAHERLEAGAHFGKIVLTP